MLLGQPRLIPPLAGSEIGCGSPDKKLVVKLFHGFADAARMSVLAPFARRGETSMRDLVEAVWAYLTRGPRTTCAGHDAEANHG